MEPHGVRLKNYLGSNGIKQLNAAQKLDIHVNTLRNWFYMEEFTLDMLNKLFSAYPALINVYSEVQYFEITIPSNPNSMGALNDETDLETWKKRAHHYQEGYISTLKKYNEMLEKHVALQQEVLVKCGKG